MQDAVSPGDIELGISEGKLADDEEAPLSDVEYNRLYVQFSYLVSDLGTKYTTDQWLKALREIHHLTAENECLRVVENREEFINFMNMSLPILQRGK